MKIHILVAYSKILGILIWMVGLKSCFLGSKDRWDIRCLFNLPLIFRRASDMPSRSTVIFFSGFMHVLLWSLIPGNTVYGIGLEATLPYVKCCLDLEAVAESLWGGLQTKLAVLGWTETVYLHSTVNWQLDLQYVQFNLSLGIWLP